MNALSFDILMVVNQFMSSTSRGIIIQVSQKFREIFIGTGPTWLTDVGSMCESRESITWLLDNNYPYTWNISSGAARIGDLVLLERSLNTTGFWSNAIPRTAAKYGHLDILKYGCENGHNVDKKDCSYIAIENGNLECLKYLWEENFKQPVIISTMLAMAASYGHLDCLKYLHSMIGDICIYSAHAAYAAARGGRIDCLSYLMDSGAPKSELICSGAAMSGNLDCLIYVRSIGCEWSEDTCTSAANEGNLNCLQYARQGGCPWNEDVYLWAARHGYLHILKYAHENGCPWHPSTCLWATMNGQLECLMYAHMHGAPIKHYDNLRLDTIDRACSTYIRSIQSVV